MQQTFQTVKALIGLAVILAVTGWCLYRLLIWFGIISIKKTLRRFKRRMNK